MPYNPMMYMPQNYQPYQAGPAAPVSQPSWASSYPGAQVQQPYDMRIRVKGRNGAEAFQMPPNSHAILFDEDNDVMYYKATDAAGYPSIVDFDFFPRKQETRAPAQGVDYVPRAEFDKLADAVGNLMANLGYKEDPDGE